MVYLFRIGDFLDDMSHGHGTYRSVYGDVYIGGYKKDKRHGSGKLKTAMGTTIQTEWENGERVAGERPLRCCIA